MLDVDEEQHARLDAEVKRLLASGAWGEVGCTQHITKAFLVSKKSDQRDAHGNLIKKWRLVVDLRHVNSYCQGYTTKYQTLATLSRWGVKGSYRFS